MFYQVRFTGYVLHGREIQKYTYFRSLDAAVEFTEMYTEMMVAHGCAPVFGITRVGGWR